MIIKLSDLKDIYESEIRKNVRNRKKILEFEKHKIEYLIDIKYSIENNLYNGGKYNIFLVFKPKTRVIMSQSIYDKIINHYVTRHILMPKLNRYLNDRNCATRTDMGLSYAVRLLLKDISSFKKYKKFYFLKLDISKFFYSIDHEVLINLIKDDLDEEELNIVKLIINSTNKSYINKVISLYESKNNVNLPRYEYNKGLPIGNMTSQFLAVFYLSKLQHYIRHNLKLKYVSYMDDYIIIHENKEYLKKCLNIIIDKLNNEYKLDINENKTFIVNAKEGITFLGYNIKVINNKTIIKLNKNSRNNIKRGIKRSKYYYKNNLITFKQYFSSIENYKNSYMFASRKEIKNIFERYG